MAAPRLIALSLIALALRAAGPATDAERERFLATADVVARRPAPSGVTDSERLVLL